jgi:hypothetical protein
MTVVSLGVAAQLLANIKALNEGLVPRGVYTLQVIQEPATGTYHFQKAPAGMMVFLVTLKVRRQKIDPLGQKRDLNFGRSGVSFVSPVARDHFRLFGLS